jgi:virginiamycin B lyase
MLVAAVGLGLAIRGFVGQEVRRRPSPAQTAPVESPDLRVTATIPLGQEFATKLPVAEGAVWVGATEGREDSGAVLRIDTATNEVVARVPLSRQPWYLAAGAGAVWAAVAGESVVYRIDPGTNAVSASIPVPGDGIGAIAAGPEGVWVEAYEDRSDLGEKNPTSLVRIDPSTNNVVATIPLGSLAGGYDDEIALGQGGVWLVGVKLTGPSEERGGALVRVDPGTNRIAAIIPVAAFSVGAGPGGVWVSFPEDGVVGRRAGDRWLAQRIDPATNQVSGPPVPMDFAVLAVTEDGVWFHGYDQQERVRVVLLDPATLEVVASGPPVESYYSGAALDEESRTVWLATVDSITRFEY